MIKEVKSAVQLVVHILSLNNAISKSQLEKFAECLEKILCLRYEAHWHPQKPCQGSAYRCLRITNTIMDSVIEKAASMSGLQFVDLHKSLPQDFTLWIDPFDVSYRIGEEGSICCLFSSSNDESPPPPPPPSSAPSNKQNISLTTQSCQSEVPKPIVIQNASSLTKCTSWGCVVITLVSSNLDWTLDWIWWWWWWISTEATNK